MSTDLVIRATQAAGAYRRVQFEDFGRPSQPEPEVAPVLAEPEPAVLPPEPEPAELPQGNGQIEIAPGIHLPTADEVEQIHQEAYKAGYDIGYEEGSARGRLEAAELHQLLSQFDENLSHFDETVGAEILALALEVARLVVRDHVVHRPESLLIVVREALNQMPQQHATLHVHTEDSALVRQYLGEQYAHAGHRIIEDDSVERGGCRIEVAGTHLDATVATRWRRVVENLSREHPWEDD
ncbi:flagellar assembly protein FliH [Niveibacterium umoris]|uniref:Flagellar assembly protein FliH n=1 Tax=Niveibacterium umoris TaxID=1193620 RepID=A0A840BC83_9RHOO|nr:flagellar assembly protein FliH [Niveibacterium umoris]MBB4011151.1 flagellar assembly protein FliH [Niveibacterium umoris]